MQELLHTIFKDTRRAETILLFANRFMRTTALEAKPKLKQRNRFVAARAAIAQLTPIGKTTLQGSFIFIGEILKA